MTTLDDYIKGDLFTYQSGSIGTYDLFILTAKQEGKCYFSFYKEVDEIKKMALIFLDYFNIFGVKKFIYVKIGKENEFLESDCDNSRFEIENL